MEPITTLSGYLLSRLLHGMRIILLTSIPCLFISHLAIAYNIRNKAPSSEDGDRSLRGIQSFVNESRCIAPNNSSQTLAFESGIKAKTTKNGKTSNFNTFQKYYEQLKTENSVNDLTELNITTLQSKPSAGDEVELASDKLRAYRILDTVQQQVGASAAEMKLFCNYYYDKLFGSDVSAFWNAVLQKQITTDTDIKNYAYKRIKEYSALFTEFRKVELEYPNSIEEYSHQSTHSTQSACNPACDNIGFENGNLSAWSAYYAQNTSSTTAFSNTVFTGGACGAVTRSAFDPNTNDYQVALMSGTGVDPVAGALIPVVCPTGGSYSCRIGDSTRNGAQMGQLEQTFTVTTANANFVYMYAVVLENPGHTYYQQPYFNVQMLDQNGNSIPNCGNYSVVSGPGLPGYKGIYYTPDADTVYCKPWTTVFVPLQAYIGQCITIKVTVSDCELGGHFGYAYFDATCVAGIITSLPTLCSNVATLTANAPSGASSYLWSGPCIVGPNNQQSIKVSCAGIYKVAVTSIIGGGCADTIVDTVTGSPVPAVSTNQSLSNVSCYGGNNGSATASASGGLPPYSYSWSPTGGTNATVTNLTAGAYQVIVTDADGCSDTARVNITQPATLGSATGLVTNVNCNSGNNGSASVNVSGGTSPYTYLWAPIGGSANSATNLTAGTYTINITDANGCNTSTLLTVSEPPALTSFVSTTPVSCNNGSNGSANDIVTGGTPPYTYTWSPNIGSGASVINLPAGTYVVTVSDANHCTLSASDNVTEPTALTTSSSSSSVSCFGGNNGSATVAANGGTPPYKYSWAPNNASTSIANNISAGTYTVIITDANSCKITSTINVTQPAVLSSLHFSTNITCNGGNNGSAKVVAVGGVSPYSYTWVPNVSSTDSATNLTVGIYSVIITDARGCITPDNITLLQPSLVNAAIGHVTNVSCYGGNNGVGSVSVTGGIPPYSYSWIPQGGANYTASNLTAGTYTVEVRDANNCPATVVTTITQPSPLNVNVASLTDVSCYGGNNGSASVSTTGGTSLYSYTWSPNVSNSYSANNLTPGTYTIAVTDANRCTTNTTVLITQPTALTSKLVSATNINCNGGNNGSIVISAAGGSPSYFYSWTPNISTSASAANLTSGVYKITVTDSHGCTSQLSEILSQPSALITNSSVKIPTCNGLQNGSATIITSGGTPSYKYVWGTSPPQFTNAAINIGAGVYTVLVTDANGCNRTDTVQVTQPFPLMSSIVNTTNPICYGDSSGSASVYVTGGTLPYSYIWSTYPKQTTYNATKLSAGTYMVSVLDANNCPVSSQVTITQPTPVITKATAPDSICSGTTVTIVASGIGGNGSYHYIWSTGSGSIATQNVTPLNTTTYTITAIDGNGCKGNPATVIINTWNLGSGNLSVTPPQTICFGDTVVLYASITNANSGNVNINWSNGFNGTGPFYLVLPDDTIFTVSAMNQCGSKTSAVIPVKVNPLPHIQIPVQTGASCRGVTFTYYDSSAINESYTWSFGDGSTGNTNPISHLFTQSGLYNVTVTVTSTQGCSNSATAPANVTIYPTAIAKFIADPREAPITEPTISFTDGSVNADSWAWDFGDNGSNSHSYERNPKHTYTDTGSYIVHQFTNNTFGCPDTATEVVHILPEFTFYVPDAFSPNGDGLNETFNGKGIGIIEYDMVIYDRWGMFLFETHDLYKGWDGTVGGGSKMAQEDTYVYVIKLTDLYKQQHSYIGSVTLLK
ncbi:MAG TPA: PKD domain-containing protein [Bacteroidia bacterium]|nr:PKD domain-containing protein [Bacteroidia bacterium]